jgi:hypothetical protein
MYHSFALLLADGRVLAAGNEPDSANVAGWTYELYYPPYLFTAGPSYAPRPVITSVSPNIFYGLPILVHTGLGQAADIDNVVLMKPSSVTHAVDMSQRRVRLERVVIAPSTIAVTAPWQPEVAPPGDYMLFLIDGGVPSEGKFVTLKAASSTDDTGQHTFWSGTVRPRQDFTVQPGDTLEIHPGTKILAQYPDKKNDPSVGKDASLVEIINRGTILAQGTWQNPIIAAATDSTAAHWYGFRDLPNPLGVPCGYGYACTDEFSYLTVRNAKFGIALEDTCAPRLERVDFKTNAGATADIYIDRTDLVVPDDCLWTLIAPTRVVVTNTAITELGHPVDANNDLVDIFVRGDIQASCDPCGGADSVRFTPETPTTNPGEFWIGDWGGIYVDWTSDSPNFRQCVITHAANPLFISGAYHTRILDSRIEYYSGAGITLWGGIDNEVQRCVVRRGTGMHKAVTQTGILVKDSAPTIVDNTIGHNATSGLEAALKIEYTPSYCGTVVVDPETLLVASNTIHGPGDAFSDWFGFGFVASWVCGAGTDRVVKFEENSIKHWNVIGLWMDQVEDVQIDCNRISRNNLEAIYFSRNYNPSGPMVRFKNNVIDSTRAIPGRQLMFSDNVLKMKLGGTSTLNRGMNIFRTVPNVPLLHEVDGTNQLEAQNNRWMEGATDLDLAAVQARIVNPSGPQALLSPLQPGLVVLCTPTAAHRGQGEGVVGSGVASADNPGSVSLGVPASTEVGKPTPTPFREGVMVSIALSGSGPQRVKAEVYDVQGRQVRVLMDDIIAPGWHSTAWDGRDGGSRRAAPGVYFVRVKAGDLTATRKVVLLR